MSKYKYHCSYCDFRTNDLTALSQHEAICQQEQQQEDEDLLCAESFTLATLREDARLPEELIDLLRDLILEVRRK